MSKLDELIDELCPDGVEYKTLIQLGKFYGGLSGKAKDDFTDGNAKFITYKNVYSNPALNVDVEEKVKITNGEKQHTLQYADVIFTGSSETPDECGFSSVLTKETDENLYLNSFCFFFRFDEPEIMLPNFAKHLFRSNALRIQIRKTANGVTRFNVSKKLMEKVVIPRPPLPVQEEIVRILDNFTELTTELTAELAAELTARKKQYEYYQNELLTFGNDEVVWKALGDVSEYSKMRIASEKLDKTNYVGVDNLLQNKAGKTESNYIPTEGNSTGYLADDILIGNIRPYLKKIWYADCVGGTNGDVLVIHPTDININPKYLYQVLADDKFFEYNMKHAKGAKMPRGNKNKIMEYPVPIPYPNNPIKSLEEQNRIVAILDRFDKLCNDISEELPAEIKAREQQYEYYRDKLLTFPKAEIEV